MLPLEDKRILLTGSSGFIGTSLVDLLESCGAEVVNADISAPLNPAQRQSWRRCDVGSLDELSAVTADVDPHFVLHLAARTDTDSSVVADYTINHVGTHNVVQALKQAPSAARFVLVSTQFVLGPGVPFKSEQEFAPHTAYGESKVRAERGLREAPPEIPWTIVRPTNVWGPWHLRYQREFWRMLRRGLYLHPTAPDPIRSYGYVGSVCLQMLGVLLADEDAVHGRALYVGDEPIRLSRWVDAFSVALRGKPARRVPGTAIAGLAKVGDLARKARLPAPISSSRYRSMTQDYPTPMHRTAECLGRLPTVPLQLGVAETVGWLDEGVAADVRAWLTYYPPAGRKEEETNG